MVDAVFNGTAAAETDNTGCHTHISGDCAVHRHIFHGGVLDTAKQALDVSCAAGEVQGNGVAIAVKGTFVGNAVIADGVKGCIRGVNVRRHFAVDGCFSTVDCIGEPYQFIRVAD